MQQAPTTAICVECGSGPAHMSCSICTSLGFPTDPLCSHKCVDQALAHHESLHLVKPVPELFPFPVAPVYRRFCGRCIIATQDINPGQICLTESPVIYGTWKECVSMFNNVVSESERVRILAFLASDDEEIVDDAIRIGHRCIPLPERSNHTDDLIGILHNNSIDLCYSASSNSETKVGLFEWGSLVSHSCNPNVEGSVKICPDTGVPLWSLQALKPIKRGEILGWNYNVSIRAMMEGTSRRRAEILELRGFLCRCDACNSIDYLRSFRCPNCKEGVIAGVDMVNGSEMMCQSCRRIPSHAFFSHAESEERTIYLQMNESNAEDLPKLLQRACHELSSYHGIVGRLSLEVAVAEYQTSGNCDPEILTIIRKFLSSPSLKESILVHTYFRERLPINF
uniref:SET domain-containing protein n=1 Tax=Spongospora subterranea TaxID=70186 RepID=A0A0H5RMW5_9EUKA|eukprot:CRZ10079.1 hypothetical protein [Spongospora subterranea]